MSLLPNRYGRIDVLIPRSALVDLSFTGCLSPLMNVLPLKGRLVRTHRSVMYWLATGDVIHPARHGAARTQLHMSDLGAALRQREPQLLHQPPQVVRELRISGQ
jgi:hypothetical protein